MSYLGRDNTPFDEVFTDVSDGEWLPYGVGIDVHLKFAWIVIVTPNYATRQVKLLSKRIGIDKNTIEKAADWICETLAPQAPPFNYVIESTSTYHFPFLRYFGKRMVPIVINPTIAGKDKRKADKYDARKLANHGMTGLWKPTPIVFGKQEVLRVRTRTRIKTEQSRTRLTNRIGTRLVQYGITFVQELKASTNVALDAVRRIIDGETVFVRFAATCDLDTVHFEGVKDLPDEIRSRLKFRRNFSLDLFLALTYQQIQEIDEKLTIFDTQIRQLVKTHWPVDFSFLITIPGIGVKTAEVFLAEIGNSETIKRFPKGADSVAAFAALSPEQKVSAGKVTSKLKRGGNKWIKTMLIQGAQSVMRRDIPLAKWGHAIRIRSKEGGGKKAVAAVARRMCVAGYHVLRTQKPYDDSKSDYKAAQTSFRAKRDQGVLKKHWYELSVR
jgi:transposase